MADKFLVIDGSSLIHRAFFALPPLTNRKGQPTGAVYGFLRMFHKLLQEVQPRWVVAAFDKSRKTFRTELFADYKGQRKATPPELKDQFPLCMEVLRSMGIAALEEDDYEADDIIGTFVKKADPTVEVYVVTGDRDELQLIDQRTRVMYTKRGISEIQLYDREAFQKEYEGLEPLQLIDLKGLMGDSSDNIPGVPGVGPKTALKLIGEYGSVEKVLENAAAVKGKSLQKKLMTHQEQALLSKNLATIYTEVPVNVDLANYALKPIGSAAQKLMADLEFRGLFDQFSALLGKEPGLADNETLDAGAKVDGRQEADAVSATGSKVSSAQGENSGTGQEEGMASLFGTVVPGKQAEEITTAAQWEKTVSALDQNAMVWFIAQGAGTIPQLYFTSAEVLLAGKSYRLTDPAALTAFAQWLAASPNPKGTVNCKDIYKICACHKLQPRNLTEDIALGAYLDDPGRSGYALKDLAWQYLGEDRSEDCQTLEKVSGPVLRSLQGKELLPLYREIELPLTRVLAAMELTGVKADVKNLELLSGEMARKIKTLESLAKEQAGEESFNPNSPKQLGVVLFEKLKLPVIKKTKTGYSTDVKVLEELKGQHPLIETILQYRMLAKLHSTYLEGLKPLINKTTGRIHTHFQQTVTVTGRLSSTDPNLQNIPTRTDTGREIRTLFVPGEGYDWLLSCDYSQIELRILAHISQDPLMLESFRENQDVHARTASEVFGVPLDLVSSEMRSRAKAVNFGIVYGISDFGLAVQLGCSRKEAGDFIQNYLSRYKGVKAYMDGMIALAHKQGYVATLLGRRRYLPEINHRNFNLRSFAERTAINTPIQGTAADVMKLAMLKVDKALQASGLTSHVLLQVHDELVLEVKETEREATAALVQREMQNAFPLSVPLLAEVNYGKDWASAK
ncbi:MAG: DNA polymerase I [Succiniclasticum sp.]|nr:DNA polymerase I [Succiniclasticum sp.]